MMITPHFSRKELQCKCCGECVMDERFLELLEQLRAKTGRLKVNSGYRCPEHNAEIGGVPNSWHTKGRAADLVPLDCSIEDLEVLARPIFREVVPHATFIHVARE